MEEAERLPHRNTPRSSCKSFETMTEAPHTVLPAFSLVPFPLPPAIKGPGHGTC